MKKIIIGFLMFLPFQVLAYVPACTPNWYVPSCAILTNDQIVQQSKDYASIQGSKYVDQRNSASSKTGISYPNSPINYDVIMKVSSSDAAIIDLQTFLSGQYNQEFNILTAQNSQCQPLWDTYNKEVSDYDACMATPPPPTPLPAPVSVPVTSTPVAISTPTPITIPVVTITPVLVAPIAPIPTTTAPVSSIVPNKVIKPTPSAQVVNSVTSSSPQVNTAPQPTPAIQSVQPVQKNIFIKFWSFIKSLF